MLDEYQSVCQFCILLSEHPNIGTFDKSQISLASPSFTTAYEKIKMENVPIKIWSFELYFYKLWSHFGIDLVEKFIPYHQSPASGNAPATIK